MAKVIIKLHKICHFVFCISGMYIAASTNIAARDAFNGSHENESVNVAIVQLNDSIDFKTITAVAIQLRSIINAQKTKAIIFKLDSPGGSPAASQEIINSIEEFKKHGYIIAYIPQTCASACYQIAAHCNVIIASPTAYIGSIGVISEVVHNIRNITLNNNGGSLKADMTVLNPQSFSGSTDKMKNDRIMLLDYHYKEFTDDVQQHRAKLKSNIMNEWAEGRLFSGIQAHNMGLIDMLGSLASVIEYIKTKFNGHCVSYVLKMQH